MRVPDGTDYLKLMLYDRIPPPESRGTAHHLCLMVPDAEKAVAAIDGRTAGTRYTRPVAMRTGAQSQATGESVRSRRYPCGADGAEHRRRPARAAIDLVAAPAV